MDKRLTTLIVSKPELSEHRLIDAWIALEEGEEVRPYGASESAAHRLALAYLRHHGCPSWNGLDGENSPQSRELLNHLAGRLVDSDQDVAVLPWRVLEELLEELVFTMAQISKSKDPQDYLEQTIEKRLADDAALEAWRPPEEPGST